MARVKKPQPTLEALFFSNPEQKVLRLLLSEPTTALSHRVISSKLKGVRGLGGVEGIQKILLDLQLLGFVDFVDNQRAVRLQDDSPVVHHLKALAAICDLESLRLLLEPASSKGVLFGSRASGKSRGDSGYDLAVVSETPEEIKKIAARHPLGKNLQIFSWTPESYGELEKVDAARFARIQAGILLWGSLW